MRSSQFRTRMYTYNENPMKITPIKTQLISFKEELLTILTSYIPALPEKSILAITSKIISVCENQVIEKSQVTSKKELIEREADFYLNDPGENPYGVYLTIKNNLLMPSAGIDESNADNHYILHPSNPQETAEIIWAFLKEYFGLQDLGILITDSHTSPLRRGVTGVALAWCGFKPIYDYVGEPDLYLRPLRFTALNLIDSLAAAAVLNMGEGNEQCPLCLIENAPKIVFHDRIPNAADKQEIIIAKESDLYAPLLNKGNWQQANKINFKE